MKNIYWRLYKGAVIREGDHFETDTGDLLFWHSYEQTEALTVLADAADMADEARGNSEPTPSGHCLPKIGDRIRLRHDVDRYPFFIGKEGSYGTVVEVNGQWGQISVKMDDHLDSCQEWDNCIVWTSDMGNDPDEPLAEIFAFDAEVLVRSNAWEHEEAEDSELDPRRYDSAWPCGMRVRFKRDVIRSGVGTFDVGTLATIVWLSLDNAKVKLDRTATMHGDGAEIEWDALKGQCIWDDVEEVTDLVTS